MQNEQGMINKVLGIFSFVNIMWMAAIFGIFISIGPCFVVIFGNVLKKLLERLARFIKQIVDLVVKYIVPQIIRLIRIMHETGILEIIAYSVYLQVVIEGVRMVDIQDYYSQIGVYIVFSVQLLLPFLYIYSCNLHFNSQRIRINNQLILNISYPFHLICYIPLAISIQSDLTGYVCFICFMQMMKFIFTATGFGFMLGWKSR